MNSARGRESRLRLALFLAVTIVFAPGHYGAEPHGPAGSGETEILTRILLPTFDEAALRDDRPSVLAANPVATKRPGVAVAVLAHPESAPPPETSASLRSSHGATPFEGSATGRALSRGPPDLQLD